MNKVKVIAKSECGSMWIIALPDAKVEIFTPAVIYNLEKKEYSSPRFLGSILKFVPLNINDYDDNLNAPEEVLNRLRTFKPD